MQNPVFKAGVSYKHVSYIKNVCSAFHQLSWKYPPSYCKVQYANLLKDITTHISFESTQPEVFGETDGIFLDL